MRHTFLKLDSLEGVTPGPGYVLIEAGPENDHIKLKSEDGDVVKLFIDPSYEPYKHSVTWGKVVLVPEHLTDENVEIEINEGDKIFFHYLSIPNAIRQNDYIIAKGKPYFIIQYDMCYVAVGDEGITPLNGTVLVAPVEEKHKFNVEGLLGVDFREKKHSLSEGVVKYVGKPLKGEKSVVKPGDKILYSKASDIPLQYHLHNEFEEQLFRMKHDDVLSIYN
jgi:co-chaperonin GroES (HSP10)